MTEPKGSLRGQKIAVALSGGVDSAIAALLVREAGADVIGLTLRLRDQQDTAEAEVIAEQLGIPLRIIDRRSLFQDEVERPFVESYLSGLTPSPCIRCNKAVKFGDLMTLARDLGAEALVSGHYARLEDGARKKELHRARDLVRDQSYFLFSLSAEQLSFLRFPLGEMESKAAVRLLAADRGLKVASKPDSQDICFIPDGDYAAYVRAKRPEALQKGEIIDSGGAILGSHSGVVNYTIGQRKGLNLHDRKGDHNEPLFVTRLDALRNRVIVGPRSALAVREVWLEGVNWIADDREDRVFEAEVRLRSTQSPQRVLVNREPKGKIRLVFPEDIYGVAAGQAGVVYDGDRVLGGGWIMGGENEKRDM